MPSNSCKVEEHSPSIGEAQEGKEEHHKEEVRTDSGKWAVMQSMIKQIRNGTPIYRVQLPIFLQEPRSLLERYADFCSHMDIFTRYLPIALTSLRHSHHLITPILSHWMRLTLNLIAALFTLVNHHIMPCKVSHYSLLLSPSPRLLPSPPPSPSFLASFTFDCHRYQLTTIMPLCFGAHSIQCCWYRKPRTKVFDSR